MGTVSIVFFVCKLSIYTPQQTRNGAEFSAFSPTAVQTGTHLGSALEEAFQREDKHIDGCDSNLDGPPIGMWVGYSSCLSHRVMLFTEKHLTRAEKHKIRQKQALKARKARKKDRDPAHYLLRSGWVKKHFCPRAVHSKLKAGELRAASNAWIGVREAIVESHPTLDKLLNNGYELIEWDGM